jgi:hypothetical protein
MTTFGMPVDARPSGLRWHHQCPVSGPYRLDVTVSVLLQLSTTVVDCSRQADSAGVLEL